MPVTSALLLSLMTRPLALTVLLPLPAFLSANASVARVPTVSPAAVPASAPSVAVALALVVPS